MATSYIGRFAPSPSGPLHFGSLVAALGSYLDARHHEGLWKLRFDDVDETRTLPGAADNILRSLDSFGFEWDGDILYQTALKPLYEAALEKLETRAMVYPCACTRAEIAAQGNIGAEGPIYPGTCRQGLGRHARGRSVRVKTNHEAICFEDRISGIHRQDIEKEIGDFVVRRADGFTAYQLAVVLDDQYQDITHVVRGADLLTSTPRQIYLQHLLGFPTPEYAHLPLVMDAQGRKLSKSDADRPVDTMHPVNTLSRAWTFLQPENTPPDGVSIEDFWAWAILNWNIKKVPYPYE